MEPSPRLRIADKAALDSQPLRVWQRTAGGGAEPVAPASIPPQHNAAAESWHKIVKVRKADLEDKMERLEASRLRDLNHLDQAAAGPRVVPKDCTLQPSAFNMSYDAGDSTGLAFMNQMAHIGQYEGFRLVVRATRGNVAEVKSDIDRDAMPNVTFVPVPGHSDCWLEDHGEVTVDETVSVPAVIGDGKLIERAIDDDRLRRFDDEDKADFAKHGRVDECGNQESLVAMGMASGMASRLNFSYIEGGNVLPGTLPNGDGFALVGKDSVAVTRALLERDLKRRVRKDEVIGAMAKDLGMKPDNVHPVEQPGTFHLDMAMGLLGPGQVLLNDSREAVRIQADWLREDMAGDKPQASRIDASWLTRGMRWMRMGLWKWRAHKCEKQIVKLQASAENRAWYEDRTLKDLKRAGFEVYRIAAVFPDPKGGDIDVANFTNIRQGTSPNGERFVIALGGDARAERYVAHKLLSEIPCDVKRVWFLDRALTPKTLDLWGGIKCRTKGEGTVARQPIPRRRKKTAAA